MKLQLISSNKVLKILTKQEFQIARQRGSHVTLHKKVGDKTLLVVVPVRKQIKRGTLLSIIRQAGMTKDEFINLV